MEESFSGFVWDAGKELANIEKHGVNFIIASKVFIDPRRKIFIDSKHSIREQRYFCIGKVGKKVLTVRFTFRGNKIRIIGAGYWRGGRRYYEES